MESGIRGQLSCEDLPFGFYAGKVRRAAADFQRQFNEAMAESEADEVRKNIEAIRANMGTAEEWNAGLDKPVMTGDPPRTALGARANAETGARQEGGSGQVQKRGAAQSQSRSRDQAGGEKAQSQDEGEA